MKDLSENRPGYKKTKVGWIPGEWHIAKLGEIGDFLKGAGISKFELKEKGLPCVRYGEIYTHHNFYIKKFYSFIDKESSKRSKQIEKGDILFAGSGETLEEIGKCVAYLANEVAYAGGDIVILRPKNQESKYLGFLLNHDVINRQKFRIGQGHSVVHIYSSGLREIIIPLPPLPEQKKIAEILSIWDEIIEQTSKLIAAKKCHKKALMQQTHINMYHVKAKGWSFHALGDLIEYVSRPVPKPIEPYLAIGIRSHGKGTFQRYVEEPEKVMMDTLYSVEANDLIVNITFAWEGAIAIVGEKDSGGLVSHRFPTYRLKRGEASLNFFRHLILTKRFVWDLGLISPGGAGRNRVMNKKDFLKLRVNVPSYESQEKIGQLLTTADNEIWLLDSYLKGLDLQKRGLMQKLLTGEVRVEV